ncbi:hypothetical protein ACFE04_009015 [Oxalis oulophora]
MGDPKTSVVPVLDDWLQTGNKVNVAELRRIIKDLRKRKRFSQALQVSEWMNEKGICVFLPCEHAVQLNLIGKVHGFESAENYFNSLKDCDKTDKTYGALLNCYVRQNLVDKALDHFQKMKELGFASCALSYNNIMCLYTYVKQYDKVPAVFAEMKEKNISPDNFSYRICINSYGARSDLQGVEVILREMEDNSNIYIDWNSYAVVANLYIKAGFTDKAIEALKKSEERVEKKDGTGYDYLITLYTCLGNKAEVLRLWTELKNVCERYVNKDYIIVMDSLVKLGEVEEAERILKEWEGLHEKAEAMLESLMERGKTTAPNSWGLLAAGYVGVGKAKNALKCIKVAICLSDEHKGWKPSSTVIAEILKLLAEQGSFEDVEFLESLCE